MTWTAGTEASYWLQRQPAAGAGLLVASKPPSHWGRPPAPCPEPRQQPEPQGTQLTAALALLIGGGLSKSPQMTQRLALGAPLHGSD